MKHTPPTEQTELLTIPEAAHEMRVSRTTVYRLINAGRLPIVHVATVTGGARSRVPRHAITALAEQAGKPLKAS